MNLTAASFKNIQIPIFHENRQNWGQINSYFHRLWFSDLFRSSLMPNFHKFNEKIISLLF